MQSSWSKYSAMNVIDDRAMCGGYPTFRSCGDRRGSQGSAFSNQITSKFLGFFHCLVVQYRGIILQVAPKFSGKKIGSKIEVAGWRGFECCFRRLSLYKGQIYSLQVRDAVYKEPKPAKIPVRYILLLCQF